MEQLTALLFGHSSELTRLVFQRGMALTYLLGFLNALNQFKPLLGEKGLLPVPQFLRFVSFQEVPSIFHWRYSDKFFTFVAGLGLLLSAIMLLGLVDGSPLWGSMLIWGILWGIYLSIVNVGQTFYAFGWESMVLEAGFLSIFLGTPPYATPFIILLLLRWMLFRLEFGAGLIKLRGDSCWRKLTCMNYHHETQPMPNPFSWYFHHLPVWFHKLEVIGNHVTQLIVPWGLFLPQPFPAISALIILFTQGWLFISGNYSWLGFLTMVLALTGFSDQQLQMIIPWHLSPTLAPTEIQIGLIVIVSAIVIYLSYQPVRNMLSRNQMMNACFNCYHLVNTYGAFGTVTKERFEIIVEGTDEAVITPQTKWQEYEFKAKPGDPKRRPPQFAPYHLRLDWLMWFAAFEPYHNPYRNPWFTELMYKFLENDPGVLQLIRHNPFSDHAPRFIRAKMYQYHFTTAEEKKRTGNWWNRKYIGEYFPITHLS
jgi:hypothetical protein